MTGTGFSRRVTRDNLNAFAPLLKSVAASSGGSADPGAQVGIPLPPDPLLAIAESLFAGDRLRVTKPIPRHPVAPTHATVVVTVPPTPTAIAPTDFVLMWQSKSLTRRDLTIPDASGTHATGSINLDKGLLESHIDHRHYFRDTVFSDLTWNRRNATVDEAVANFRLVVKGLECGVFALSIRHTTSTTTAAYAQNNAMTRLSWGPCKTHVAKSELIGLTLSLYRSASNKQRFMMKIS